ncbi:MAG TPA: ABC transporter ATP-binding protein, partial [Caldilinea sp.]|nr:ABC transporter ATP-binding protein [Caldilinea sp.]
LVSPRYHPTLIIVPVLFAIGYALSMWHYLRSLQPVTAAVRHAFGEMNARLTEAVEGVETVKGAAQEDREVAIFEHNARRVRDAIVAQARVEARFLPLLLLAVATGVAFGQALYLYNAGAITIGAVAAYIGLISLFDFPVFTSLFAYSQVASGLSSARRILELIRAHAVVDQNMAGHAAPMRGGVRFDRVSFRYALGAPDEEAARSALDDISFTLEPGQTLALVGQTGAGKSSIAKLINRIYDVDSGGITIDGVDVRQWNLETLRRQISIIEQDIFLFSRSIAENIAFGKPQATRAEIEQAARAAQAHDFIMSFPDEYETVVGERGMTLSGGQRQRIALARAFLTDPAILILDDSTSAIDSATEDQIQQAIERATEGRTTILITHRLSQIRWADQIVVLRKGSVAAQGSHAELIERSQPYRDIFARL